MPRRARLAIAGIPWHIIQRGNNRAACFYTDDDYRFYLHQLKLLSAKFHCQIHAYVLMTNHVHLLLTPELKNSASLLMKNLGQRYVQYINRTYKRTGTLWEGRFKSCLTQSENYVLACYRYIELNPVRAAMVQHPNDYPWSSYRFNAHGESSTLITPHNEYLHLSHITETRLKVYKALFKVSIDDQTLQHIRSATHGNYALGNNRFEDEIAQALKRRVTKGKAGRPVV